MQCRVLFARAYYPFLTFGYARVFLLGMAFSHVSFFVFSQGGETGSFAFLNLPPHARLAALGGVNVSLADRDVNFFMSNPALVSDTLAGFASANYQFYVADIGHAGFSYLHDFNKVGLLGLGVQHLNYGTIVGYDATGQQLGDFNASSTALVLTKSHQVRYFRIGVNVKAAFTNIAGFRTRAVVVDLGGAFVHPEKDLCVGVVIKNAGVTWPEQAGTSDTKLPFDVQLGVTFKPEHMPFRFSLSAYQLASLDEVSGTREPVEVSAPGRILRHFNFAGELLLHRNVNVLVGYNYRIHQELKLENGGGMAGVSFGFSARIKSFELVFSRSTYVVGNAGYGFTLCANIEKTLTR